MSRTVFVTDIDTTLGNGLVRLFLEAGDRVFATSTGEESTSSFNQVAGDSLRVARWERRSPVAARNMVAKALSAFEGLDLLVLLGPPAVGRSSLLSEPASEIEEAIDQWVKGNIFLTRELLGYFARRRSGALAFVAQNSGPETGVLGEVARASFQALASALLRRQAAETVALYAFESGSPSAEDYAAFVHRTLSEKARRGSTRLFRHASGWGSALRRR